ncbi:hypothetical protein [Anaeromyxobacter oryzae]|uniref:Phosphatidic acid phosphatase type 2/haloperoxidase domain-containing protein n=1 Tax=Anaeromyxobacter oryzae TaxID=2918170 RepID=A0ABN6N0P5_9BACT|nr:hypothetical protein [Anaeromyxobacter oryzae]BDG06743.1 hypothetical protein AMOR_57390 [Anaeromyxobacter oryzae]
MPPFFPQPPLDALAPGAPRWLDVALTAVTVACEPWALALIGVAVYSWLEREVPAVLKAAAPLVAALAAGGGLAFAARFAWAAPRLAGAGEGLAPLLHRVLPGAQVVGLGVFVAYSLLAYGRRAAPAAIGLAGLGGAARVWASPHWVSDLAGGGAAGALLGAVAYLIAVRLFPEGHLARLRAARRAPSAPPEAEAERPAS